MELFFKQEGNGSPGFIMRFNANEKSDCGSL